MIHYKLNFIQKYKWTVLSRLGVINCQSDSTDMSTDGKLTLQETLSFAV